MTRQRRLTRPRPKITRATDQILSRGLRRDRVAEAWERSPARTKTRRLPKDDGLATSPESLRSLSARLDRAREEERARVARELHDELGQVLTSLKLEFEWLVDQIRNTDPKPGVQFVNKLQSLIGLIEVSIETVRRISGDLRPAALDQLGLPAAIQWEATKFQARTGIRCRVISQLHSKLLDRERAIAVFRIVQEALTNVARHAHAGAVQIRLQEHGNHLNLTVKDNGRGITKAETSNVRSIGLLGMQERARLLGGHVTIAGVSGRGTTVKVQMPIEVSRRPAQANAPGRT